MAIEPLARDVPDFDALVTEAVTLIPRLAPAWTDHNVSDPGVTLIELLAVATELGSFQVERTDAARHRTFARRFGLTPAAPKVADTVLQLHPADAAAAGQTLPGNLRVGSTDGVVFSTQTALHLQPDQIDPELVCAGAAGPSWLDDLPCQPFGAEPRPGASFTLRFERAVQGEVSLYMWTGADDHDRDLRARLIAAVAETPGARAALTHYGARLCWESLAPDGTWLPARVNADDTRALTLSGFVRLELAAAHASEDGRYPLRCRLAGGAYDGAPQLRSVLVNAVPARHEQPPDGDRLLGFSSGRAHQQFFLPAPELPVVFDSCEVQVIAPPEPPAGTSDASAPWRVVLSWDRTGPHDRHVLLDPQSGRLTFGDGRVGWVPRADHAVVTRCRYGGGSAGNLPVGTLTRAVGSPVDVRVGQPFAARGGADAETIDELRARLFERRDRVRRAVSLTDIETLATSLPGLPVARAWALAEHHPRVPGLVASGCVTLVVIPPCPDARPMPSQALLDAVALGLDRARPLATQLIVAGPTYATVAIAARLHLGPDADPDEVRGLAIAAIGELIHPLRGGPERRGWPPGRDLHRAEVMARLMDIASVRAVDRFAFLIHGRQSRCESAPLCPQDLFTPGEHQLTLVQEI